MDQGFPVRRANHIGLLAALGIFFLASVESLFDRHARTIFLVLYAAVIATPFAALAARRYWGLAVFGVLGLTACGVLLWHAAAPSFADLKRDGEQMVAAVEHYHRSRGRYPTSLEQAGVAPLITRYGPWVYRSDGSSFTLSVGDYREDLFVFSFDSNSNCWHADT